MNHFSPIFTLSLFPWAAIVVPYSKSMFGALNSEFKEKKNLN